MKPQPMSDAEITRIAQTLGKRVPGLCDFSSWGQGYQADKSGAFTVPRVPDLANDFAAAIIAARDAQWAAMIGEPVAWVAAGGKAFSDRPMLSKAAADAAVAHRRDGSTVSPLYAIKETP